MHAVHMPLKKKNAVHISIIHVPAGILFVGLLTSLHIRKRMRCCYMWVEKVFLSVRCKLFLLVLPGPFFT